MPDRPTPATAREPGDQPAGATRPRSRSRGPRSSGEQTRTRVMETAQRMFAERSIDAVSLNEIVQQAEVNTAAIHYHFRSKDGLVEAILEQGATTLGERREQLLDELDAKADPELRDVVAAVVLPITEMARTPWGLAYAQFLGRVAAHAEYRKLLIEQSSRYTPRILAALERVTPGLDPQTRLRRFAYAREIIYHAVAVTHGAMQAWMAEQGYFDVGDSLADDLIDLLSAGLGATGR